MTTLVETSFENGLLRVCINRPEKRNALSAATLAEIAQAFEERAGKRDLRLAVLTGAGEKSFAAGGDITELQSVVGEVAAEEMVRHAKAALSAVRNFPVPVVAALNGDALGGGAELALACDMRIAAFHARIGFIQGRLAISSAWGGGVDLIRLIGPSLALQMMSRAEMVEPDEALRSGLYNRYATENEPLEEALEAFIAPMLEQSAHVMRAFKALALHVRRDGREEMDRTETENFAKAWAHPDHDLAVERVVNRKRNT